MVVSMASMALGHDAFLELVLLDDHGLDSLARLKADVIQRLKVRGIGHADVEPLAALLQRQHAIAVHELLGNEPHDVEIER